ncbi:hypothetical protein [Brevibacterium moorei]|uniref:hypothetical protein n=1 Tax=Brevibacterium moorei TaxID=2968457 RepID=UPI00211C52AF|nr:hypothetical protein [Brevibacterium sp. 68QC2CO]MCQ9386278.1 hypothetical protein [Brevibacterium sp. 68QC2CO]
MLSANVHVAADKSAQLTIAGTTTQHPDLASALNAARGFGRTNAVCIRLDIVEPSGAQHSLDIDQTGGLTPSAQADAPAAAAPQPPAAPAEPTAAQVSGRPATPPTPQTETDRKPIAPDPAHGASAPTVDPAPTPNLPTQTSADAITADGQTADRAQPSASTEKPGTPAALAGTQFSGPADPLRPRGSRPKFERTRSRRKRAQRIGGHALTIPGIVLLVLPIVIAIAYLFPQVVGSPGSDAAGTEGVSAGQGQYSSLNVETTEEPVPGFSKTSKWSAGTQRKASATASSRGVLIVEGKSLRVLNPATGKQRYSTSVKDPVTFAVDTRIGKQSALVWRTGDTAFALFDGSNQPVKYSLPKKARISSAGSSIIIKSGDALYTFGEHTLDKLPRPAIGSTPMALDESSLISAKFAGPLQLTDIQTGQKTDVKLEQPAKDLHIIRWISAGYGNVVTLWGDSGSRTNSGHAVQLVVHNAKTGAIKSTVSTSTDSIGQDAKWIRGQGHQLAVIGPYLFDMRTGLLVRDGTGQHVDLSDPRGAVTPGILGGEAVLVSGDTAWRTTTNLLAVTDDGQLAIVRQGNGSVVAYPKE